MLSELLLPALYCKVVTLSYLLRVVFSDVDFIAKKNVKRELLVLKIFYFFRTPANSRLLHREVVRLVTPGTLLEPLKPDANYLMSIARGPDSSLGLAWLDLSTGEFHLGVSSLESLEEDLSRVNPAEVGVVLAMGVNAFVPLHVQENSK